MQSKISLNKYQILVLDIKGTVDPIYWNKKGPIISLESSLSLSSNSASTTGLKGGFYKNI